VAPYDALSGDVYDRSGSEMRDSGLYVDLPPGAPRLRPGPLIHTNREVIL